MKKTLLAAACLTVLGLSSAVNAATPVIKVTLLGTGVPLLNADALKANGRALAGLLVQAGSERMLFDCGQGVYNRLVESGGGMLNPNVGVDKVFISHLHSDHIADLAPLYSIGALYRHPNVASTDDFFGVNGVENYPFPTKTPLKVWGPGAGPNQPVGTWAMMQSFRNAYQTDFYVRALWSGWDGSVGYPAVNTLNNTYELTEGVVYKKNGVKVTAFLVNHNPVSPSYGFKVEYQGHSVVYSGDTAPTPNMVKYGKGVDLLVHEVYGYSRDAAPNIFDYHTSPEDAATIFGQAKPKQVVYTHLVIPPGTSADDLVTRTKTAGYAGKIAAGTDLMVINVNDDGTVSTIAPSNAKAINAAKATSDFAEIASSHRD